MANRDRHSSRLDRLRTSTRPQAGLDVARPLLMSIAQAAMVLGWTHQQLYGRVKRGQVPYTRVGHRIYFTELDLQRWILRKSVAATR